jgi:hypothetical protein
MDCPFCAETIKDEALACKSCARDLRVVRPVLLEIQDLVEQIEQLRSDLDRTSSKLQKMRNPLRHYSILAFLYVLILVFLLVTAHAIVTIVLNASPLYLRLASLVIPVPFGFLAFAIHKIRFRGALLLGVAAAMLAVTCMLMVTAFNDSVPILPAATGEWREVLEYAASIALALASGNIVGVIVFGVLPRVLSQSGKPNAAAFKVARLLGQHVGEEQLRRRARLIQDLLQTIGPLVGVLMTAVGSIYAGLKGVMAS